MIDKQKKYPDNHLFVFTFKPVSIYFALQKLRKERTKYMNKWKDLDWVFSSLYLCCQKSLMETFIYLIIYNTIFENKIKILFGILIALLISH